MPPSSVWTKRPRFRPWIDSTRFCRSRPAGLSATASSTCATVRRVYTRLYVAFNSKNGTVVGKTAARHTSAEFVGFLTDLVATQPRRKEIHVIVDNLSAHKTKLVDEFLATHPNVHLHFTPT